MKKWVIALLILMSFCGIASGITILEPGYTTQTYAQFAPTTRQTYSMAFDNAGSLYLAQPYDDKIWKVATDGTATQFVDAPSIGSGLEWTGGTAYGDFLYATAHSKLLKVAPDGTYSTFGSGLPAASEVAVDTSGNYAGQLYVSTGGQDHIYSINPAGGVTKFTDWPGWTDGGGPIGMEFAPSGDYAGLMYVACYFGSNAASKSGIFTVDVDGDATRFVADLALGKELAFDIEGLLGGNLFAIAAEDFGELYKIWRITPDGIASEFAITTQSEIGSLVFGQDGALYISEYSSSEQTITVTRVIPEPATILLLALAVPFTRRRSLKCKNR